MMNPRHFLALLLLVTLIAFGCSDSGSPTAVDQNPQKSVDSDKSNLGLMGFYTVRINASSGEVEITPHREGLGVMNAMNYLDPAGSISVDYSTLEIDPVDLTVDADLTVSHPYLNTKYTAFELRGVIFGPEVSNADGTTRWMNPVEFSGLPYGYQNFSLGTPYDGTNFQREVNGYKLFIHDIPNPQKQLDLEGGSAYNMPYEPMDTSFGPGDAITSHFSLDFAQSQDGWLVFQLAVVANYAIPTGPGPWEPGDFPPNAHCPEPFFMQATVYNNNLFNDPTGIWGNEFSLAVKVYDMRDPAANNVFIESSDLGIPPTPYTAMFPGALPFEMNYVFENIATPPPPPAGDYPLTIHVIDPLTYGQAYMAGTMPTTHPLYSTTIHNQINTELHVSDLPFETFMDQVGFLTYDPVDGGEGRALASIIFDGRYVEGTSASLDTGPFGLGILNVTGEKGEGGYQFPINNDIGLPPGMYPLNFNINTVIGPIGGVFMAEVIAKAAKPPPFWTHAVTYGANNIGTVNVDTFTAAACGVNIEKNFSPNGTNTDCAEYRWIQVISTDSPISPTAPTSYVDPYGNDDPPGPHANDPYYWTDGEANSQNTAGAGQPRNPTFEDRPRRPAPPAASEPLWWHAELILVCVRPGQPDVLLHSEHYFFFKDADGTVHEGHYDGQDGGSALARSVLARDFPGYSFT